MKQEDDWELYSVIDENGRFPKKIQKEREEYDKQLAKEYEEMYWKECQREAFEFNENTREDFSEYDCNEIEY